MLVHLLRLPSWPIYQQLILEEALLRADTRNWCLINAGSVQKAIVMGISGKPELLIEKNNHLPVIRRFSGGGTVVVDDNTLFATFICNREDAQVPCYPDQIHCWAKEIYQDVFTSRDFALSENDYGFGSRKFGGNAQYLCKDRWLHHTSFLWDFDHAHMDLLKIPSKQPKYRENRSHADFLCTLKECFVHKEDLNDGLIEALKRRFQIQEVDIKDAEKILLQPHRRSTTYIK